MPLPSFTQQTNNISPADAPDVNLAYDAIEAIAGSTPRADYSHTRTLAATLTLTDADLPLQYLDPGGASRDVNLPAEASTNNPFVIVNTADAAENLVVKSDAPATIITIGQNQIGYLWSNGVVWRGAVLDTETLTNKRITKRVASTTDDATAVIDSDSYDEYYLTAVANATEISVTGTPTAGQTIFIGLKDAGVSKALTWTGITALGVTLPTATTAGKQHIIGVKYIAAAWRAIAVSVEA